MKLRPCIDIHNGKVKQIVGSSLRDETDTAEENFVSHRSASYFANLYREKGLSGGHVILLNQKDSPYYEGTYMEALSALKTYPNGLQAGGGITDENAEAFIAAGASHVIITSFVFRDGEFNYKNLQSLKHEVGRDRIVLDLSCKNTDKGYFVVTNRWQTLTDFEVNEKTLKELSNECDEFLIHAVDREGKRGGIDEELLAVISKVDSIPVTYAGGVRTLKDIERIRSLGDSKVDYTVGSALSLFGGSLRLEDLIE